jgi:Dolichyl-phosphate-mannose-protein mannosyltransferase
MAEFIPAHFVSWLRSRNPWDRATRILLLAVGAIICLTFRDYGVSWDEEFSHTQGIHFLKWYASGFRDHSVMTATNNENFYGGFFNGVAAFFADHSPFGTYETVHLVIAVTGLIGIVYAYRLGRLLAGPMAGFLSALILTLTPAYYGHSFINPKDLPFAVLFLVSLYYMIRAYDELPRLGAGSVVATGTAIGLTLGIRVGGLILLGYFVILIGFWFVAQYRKNPSYPARAIRKDLRDAGVALVLVTFLAWIVMLIWWPFAQLDPILIPLRVALQSANYNFWHWTVLYRGTYIQADSLPWHYLPVSFLVTLPEYYMVALAGGLVAFLVSIVPSGSGKRKANADAESKILFFVFATFFPLALAIVKRPILFDMHRHFLFFIPPLAVLSGVSLAWLLSRVLPPVTKTVVASLLILVGAATIVDMVELHPYEYAFFNRSSGGLHAANGRYETEYWGVSYKEGAEWLINNYRPYAPRASIRVANTSNPFLTGYYLASDRPETQRFTQVGLNDHPDVILSITRWSQHLNYPGSFLHVVERMGTPFLYVIEVTPATQR